MYSTIDPHDEVVYKEPWEEATLGVEGSGKIIKVGEGVST
jgi:hypothetical protein